MISARAVLVTVAAIFIPAASGGQTTFKTGVDLVRVDVAVTRGGQPVRGLTTADFSISDSGVSQRVNSVTQLDDLAVSILMVLDISGSVEGERLQHLVDAGRGLVASLRPDDRVGLLTFADRVEVQVPLTTDRTAIDEALSSLKGRGATGIYDAVWAALQLSPQDNTRPLVLVFTDGIDNASWITRSMFVDAVRRTGVVIHAVEMTDQPMMTTGRGSRQPGPPLALEVAAEVSGGRAWSARSSRELRELFTRAITEMRGRYLVTFYPEGVPKPGWHPLKIGARGRGDVIARSGYFKGP